MNGELKTGEPDLCRICTSINQSLGHEKASLWRLALVMLGFRSRSIRTLGCHMVKPVMSAEAEEFLVGD
jgi:hypothetical protein